MKSHPQKLKTSEFIHITVVLPRYMQGIKPTFEIFTRIPNAFCTKHFIFFMEINICIYIIKHNQNHHWNVYISFSFMNPSKLRDITLLLLYVYMNDCMFK